MEDRVVPSAVVYDDTYSWAGVGTVTVTVTPDAPGYEGQYLWNYHVENDYFADDIGIFALYVGDPDAVSNLGNNMGWDGYVGMLTGEPDLVSWHGSEFGDLIDVGESGDFWFTTQSFYPDEYYGFASDTGFASAPGGLVAAPSAVVYSDTFDWNGAAEVEVTVTRVAGAYRWNYQLTNESFASGIASFALPTEVTSMVYSLGSSVSWSGSVGTFLSNSDLIAWQGGVPIDIGNSADFWFTTIPVDLAFTNGIVTDPGLTTTIGGLLVVPTALPAQPQPQKPDKFLVVTEKDGDLNNKLTTLRDAVKAASDTQPAGQLLRIRFSNGMQGKTITLSDTLGTIKLEHNNIVIDGLGKNITITRDTTKPDFRLFWVRDTAKITSFIGLKLKNGRATTEAQSKGGAIFAQGDSLTLQDCTFSDNKANNGGAVTVIAGTLDIVNCTFSNNEAVTDDGGAIFIGSVSATNITNTSITGNTAAHNGGGIMLYTSLATTSLTINNSLIENNKAADKGAGICINPEATTTTQLTLTGGTRVKNNQVTGMNGKGGGVYFRKGELILGGATITDNTATTGNSIYRLNVGTTLTIVPNTSNDYEDVTGT